MHFVRITFSTGCVCYREFEGDQPGPISDYVEVLPNTSVVSCWGGEVVRHLKPGTSYTVEYGTVDDE